MEQLPPEQLQTEPISEEPIQPEPIEPEPIEPEPIEPEPTPQEPKRDNKQLAVRIICTCGVVLLLVAYVLWAAQNRPSIPGMLAAALTVFLFVYGCQRFVPQWLSFWFDRKPDELSPAGEPKHVQLLIALISVGVELLLIFAVLLVIALDRGMLTLRDGIEFWRCLDSQHYLDITREWYVFGDEWGRTVQLVFLPGYPLAVYPLYRILNQDVIAGMLVSCAAFPAACCVFYRLLRLDLSHPQAIRAVSFLWLLPGGFFFVAPMSESLFLLLCVSALYCFRKERFALAALFGAYAAFTRTLGLMLLAPLVFEWVHALQKQTPKQRIRSVLPILAVPIGFLAYLWINYHVSGNPLQFLTYQKDHWGQELGWFFHTASYQTDLLIRQWAGDRSTFFGLWLPNLVWIFASLGLFAATSKRLRASYAVWFVCYFVIAIGTTWLLSAPRYLLAMPVVALMCGTLTEKRWQHLLAAVVLLPLSVLYLIAFVLRWQVW